MKIIFGQGNPGKEYEATRHNVAWRVLDALAEKHGATFSEKTKFFAEVAEYDEAGEKVLLVKPATFYNETGRSLAALMQFYKLDASDILIVHDELALPFGTLRSRIGGSDAGNNGIKSINQHGGTETARLRIGVQNDQRSVMGDTAFVISNFSPDEAKQLEDTIIPKCLEIVDDFVTGAHAITSHILTD